MKRPQWRPARIIAILAALLVSMGATQSRSQTLDFLAGGSDKPVEIFADDGIEWQQETKIFTATGNARAIRGDVVVHGDTLRAHYRAGKDGGSEIYRLEVVGNVKVSSPGETAYGDKGVYDLDNAILVLTGRNLKLVTAEDEIIARDSLEYWVRKELAVARGDALAISGTRRLRGDILTARFKKDKDGRNQIHQINGFGNVTVVTESEVVTADKGTYKADSGIVTLTGKVKLTRGQDQLNGCGGQVNLKTGVSTLKSCRNGGTGERVRGLIFPGASGKSGAKEPGKK